MGYNWKSWFRRSIVDEDLRKFDPYAHAVTVIDENHRLIHDGMFFEVQQSDAALVNGGIVNILLDVPAGSFPHFQDLEISTDEGPIAFDLYEGTTVSANGVALGVANKNRNSSRTAELDLYFNPTITDDGTLLKSSQVPVASVAELFSQKRSGEWVLAPSTLYLVRITNNSGQTASINITINFYELDYPEDGTAIDQPSQQT